MTRVTRNVDPDRAQELLERVPRACICFAGEQGPRAEPVVLRWPEGRYIVGLPADPVRLPSSGQEVVLLVDEGINWFDLRAIYVRGRAKPSETPPGDRGRTWFEVAPVKIVAWDYGQLREEQDEG